MSARLPHGKYETSTTGTRRPGGDLILRGLMICYVIDQARRLTAVLTTSLCIVGNINYLYTL